MFRNTGANAFAKIQMRLAYADKRDLYCMPTCNTLFKTVFQLLSFFTTLCHFSQLLHTISLFFALTKFSPFLTLSPNILRVFITSDRFLECVTTFNNRCHCYQRITFATFAGLVIF